MFDLNDLERFFDSVASEPDASRRRNRLYHNDLESLFQLIVPHNVSVVELGCGTGDLLSSLRPCCGVGVDISGTMVALARQKHPQLRFAHSAAENVSLEQKFDYILLAGLVGYAFDVQAVFEKIHTLCTPRSRIIISYHNFLWQPFLKLAEKLRLRMAQPPENWLSSTDVESLLNLTGFEMIAQGERLLCPFRLPLIAQIFNRFLCKLPGLQKLSLTRYTVARPKARCDQARTLSCSVIVPARNEKGNVQPLVDRLPPMGTSTELIWVEGHSRDGTREEIARVMQNYRGDLRMRLLVQKGEGKGDAVRKGFNAATGDVLMILDADLTVPPEELPKFFQAVASNAGEFINGSRLVYPMEQQSMRLLNLLGNKFFRLAFTWLLGQRITDTLCGTKALLRENYLKIQSNRSFFGDFDPFGDFDLLFGASKLNLKIVEIPVRYRERKYGRTNISRFKHGWLLLKMCVTAARRLKFA